MNELEKRITNYKFDHAKDCKFNSQIVDFEFDGKEILIRDLDGDISGYLTVNCCPFCGYNIDTSRMIELMIKQRKKELILSSPIKEGDVVFVKKPSNSYWKGRGFKYTVSKIEYQESLDRLLYTNYENIKDIIFSHSIEEIELYNNQPVWNT